MEERFKLTPTHPIEVKEGANVADLLRRMEEISFQGRNLATAFRVWEKMLSGETTIFFGLAGAMVPAGMRRVISFLVKNRFIDCLVSTGANLFHDIHETLGRYHYLGSPNVDDELLREEGIDRIYDTFAREKEFLATDEEIKTFSATLPQGKPITTREYFYRLGEYLAKKGVEEGIVRSAYEAGVPIYCPAIGDSSIGIEIALNRFRGTLDVVFDVIRDVVETAEIAKNSKETGVIYIGGGTPKNFIQQTEVTANYMGDGPTPGHKYAVQIVADPPHWGGLSGCTFSEAVSWGKIAKDADKVSVYCDGTIALPIIAHALATAHPENRKKRNFPRFEFGMKTKVVYNNG
ncbi:MAG: deoxyhypusine synthase [Acidobacteria bacterium]|nr:deoxyhypusine synthase [Acidobacteriota bacterium]